MRAKEQYRLAKNFGINELGTVLHSEGHKLNEFHRCGSTFNPLCHYS